MRKLLICVPMMILLLSGCGGAGVGKEEELALTIRGEYLGMSQCAARLSVTADYGQRVYQYQMDAAWGEEETVLTLTAPETVAGFTARAADGGSTLEYDGVQVETGALDQEGLTPLSAFPALLEAARAGYITACALEEDGTLLRVDCGDAEGKPGTGTETALWFDASTHALLRGEVSVDGFRVILCEVSDFSIG